MSREELKRALIVVRTYPTPSAKGVEVSCTAAITDDGQWLRLFPVPWRLLPRDQQFRKYQWVDVKVTKAKDARPESYKLNQNGIAIVTQPLPTRDRWAERKAVIRPMLSPSLCDLVRRRDANASPTLGIFKPGQIRRLSIAGEAAAWSQHQLDALRQGHLFQAQPKKQLEKIPFKFSYEFKCGEAACPGHTLMCADWEMAESYRKWRADYGDGWEAKFRHRYENEMTNKLDTHFFVGTVHQHPATWIIVGLFYPPLPSASLALFD